MKPIALTMGEPTGICPEITVKAYEALKGMDNVFYIRAPEDFLFPALVAGPGTESGPKAADHSDRDLATSEGNRSVAETVIIDEPSQALEAFKVGIPLIPLSPENAVVNSIRKCVQDVQSSHAKAITTNPVQKEFLYEDGFNFPGHTEFLGQLTDATPVMMLACEGLRVIPVTIHVPLKDVATQLTQTKIIETAKIVLQNLKQRLHLPNPKIVIAGLNPHAGENGHIGTEEQTIIQPAIQQLQQDGYNVEGCFPADTLFHAEARKHYDAALCMYHDQALIPIKTLDFWGGVNVTLGLPFLRTSPDHGTGIDIAGKGIARADSLINAIKMAHQYG